MSKDGQRGSLGHRKDQRAVGEEWGGETWGPERISNLAEAQNEWLGINYKLKELTSHHSGYIHTAGLRDWSATSHASLSSVLTSTIQTPTCPCPPSCPRCLGECSLVCFFVCSDETNLPSQDCSVNRTRLDKSMCFPSKFFIFTDSRHSYTHMREPAVAISKVFRLSFPLA